MSEVAGLRSVGEEAGQGEGEGKGEREDSAEDEEVQVVWVGAGVLDGVEEALGVPDVRREGEELRAQEAVICVCVY